MLYCVVYIKSSLFVLSHPVSPIVTKVCMCSVVSVNQQNGGSQERCTFAEFNGSEFDFGVPFATVSCQQKEIAVQIAQKQT